MKFKFEDRYLIIEIIIYTLIYSLERVIKFPSWFKNI